MNGTKQGYPKYSLISCKIKGKKIYPGKKCQANTKLVVITFILFNSEMPRKGVLSAWIYWIKVKYECRMSVEIKTKISRCWPLSFHPWAVSVAVCKGNVQFTEENGSTLKLLSRLHSWHCNSSHSFQGVIKGYLHLLLCECLLDGASKNLLWFFLIISSGIKAIILCCEALLMRH